MKRKVGEGRMIAAPLPGRPGGPRSLVPARRTGRLYTQSTDFLSLTIPPPEAGGGGVQERDGAWQSHLLFGGWNEVRSWLWVCSNPQSSRFSSIHVCIISVLAKLVSDCNKRKILEIILKNLAAL